MAATPLVHRTTAVLKMPARKAGVAAFATGDAGPREEGEGERGAGASAGGASGPSGEGNPVSPHPIAAQRSAVQSSADDRFELKEYRQESSHDCSRSSRGSPRTGESSSRWSTLVRPSGTSRRTQRSPHEALARHDVTTARLGGRCGERGLEERGLSGHGEDVGAKTDPYQWSPFECDGRTFEYASARRTTSSGARRRRGHPPREPARTARLAKKGPPSKAVKRPKR